MDIFNLMYDDFKFSRDKPIRLFEAFAGIGTQHMALKNLGLDIELVGISEIDKYAIQSYEAIHGKVKNYGGIGDFDRFPNNIDILTWSFPCQDISLAGKQQGMEDGTRSNYGYVFLDTVKNTPKEERPKVLLMENVRALFSAKFRDDWREIQLRLEDMGYTNYADVLNAKDYGVAQNRERVFIVSILGEYNYTFPKPIPLVKKLKDYLEDEVDEKYYLSDKMLNFFVNNSIKNKEKGNGFRFKPHEKEKANIAYAITTNAGSRMDDNFIKIPEATKQGYALAQDGDGVYIDQPHQKCGVVQKDKIQTLKTSVNDIGVVVKDSENYIYHKSLGGIDNARRIYKTNKIMGTITTYQDNSKVLLNNLRIRKLTPLEAWRLMGIKDEDFYKAQKSGVSDTQLYKQAGNAIVVDVLMAIFSQMIK